MSLNSGDIELIEIKMKCSESYEIMVRVVSRVDFIWKIGDDTEVLVQIFLLGVLIY